MRSPGIATALVLSLLVAASAFLLWQQYVQASDRTRRITAAMSRVDDQLADLLAADSSARGFLLTGNGKVLAHFLASSAAAEREQLSSTEDGFAGQEQLLTDLRSAATEELRVIRAAVEASHRAGTGNGASLQLIEQDEVLMATFRELHKRAHDYLRDTSRAARNRSRFLARLSQWVSTIGCAGIFGIVLLSQVRIQRLGVSRLRLNEELASANEDLRQFVYSASHDLQEPLRVLMLYSDLIERNVRFQRPVTKEVGHLRAAAKQMSALVADLLSYTQLVSEPKNADASSDLKLEAEKAIASLRAAIEEAGAQLTVGELPVVSMEGAHALLVFQNLIANSIKYRKSDERANIRLFAERAPGKWIIGVADNGIGIASAYHQQIFGIFKRLHNRAAYPGTGLGLAICRRIVERYGGTIWVESEPGVGSTFWFSVPNGSEV